MTTSGGSALSGAEVKVTNTRTGFFSYATASGSGYWVVSGLQADDYKIECSMTGYTVTRSDNAGTSYSGNLDENVTGLNFTGTAVSTLTLTSLNSGSVQKGASVPITWTALASITAVKIELYKGGAFHSTIVSTTSNDGSYTWAVPTSLATGSDYSIRIANTFNSSVFDVSNAYFSIVTSATLTVTSPDGGEQWQQGQTVSISWTSSGSISTVKIELYKGSSFNQTIVSSTANDGSYTWTVPSSLGVGTDYYVLIRSTSDSSVSDTSDAYFAIDVASVNGVAGALSSDPVYGAMAASVDGEQLIALTSKDASGNILRVTGAIYVTSDGRSATVYIGNDGLPERAISEGYVLVFRNYSNNSVDIGVVSPNGSVNVVRGVPFDPAIISELRSQNALVNSGTSKLAVGKIAAASGGFNLAGALRFAGLAVKLWGCGMSASTAVATAGIAIPLAVISCSSAILEVVSLFNPSVLPPALQIPYTAYATFRCATADPTSCISLAITVARTLVAASDTTEGQQATSINLAQSALTYGGGDVQVTLTWDAAVDVDLHVTDPSGEEIYFFHKHSNSGGNLDTDNTTGYGPENIFWAAGGAPAGQYVVDVVYYTNNGVSGSVGYKVLVQNKGKVQNYSGTLNTVSQRNRIVTFTLGQ